MLQSSMLMRHSRDSLMAKSFQILAHRALRVDSHTHWDCCDHWSVNLFGAGNWNASSGHRFSEHNIARAGILGGDESPSTSDDSCNCNVGLGTFAHCDKLLQLSIGL